MYEITLAQKLLTLFATPNTLLLLVYGAGLWLVIRDRAALGRAGRMAIVGYACSVAGTATVFASRFLQMQVPRNRIGTRIVIDQDAAEFALGVGLVGAVLVIVGAVALLIALLKARARPGAV